MLRCLQHKSRIVWQKQYTNYNANALNCDGNVRNYPVIFDKDDRGFDYKDKCKMYLARNETPKSQTYFQKYCARNAEDLLRGNIQFKQNKL